MVVVSGRLGLLVFDEDGAVKETTVLEAGGETFGVEVPAGTWHSFVSLTPGTVVFEAKEGPYVAPGGGDSAPWAPEEGAPEATTLLAIWHRLFEKTPS
jgi:cupin fold WbuC family metalloprotein